MAKVSQRTNGNGFADFLRFLEGKAAGFAVEFIRIGSESRYSPQALLLLDPDLDPSSKNELCRKVGSGKRHLPSPALVEKEPILPGMEGFRNRVEDELVRVKKSRIPCALLLIRVAGGNEDGVLGKTATIIRKEAGRDCLLAGYDEKTAALLLPGLNRRKAAEQAGVIHAACTAAISEQTSVGLTVCVARDVPPADAFIARAATELDRAKEEGWQVFHSFQEQQEDLCQVTAEERAQLFSFLHGERNG